MSSQLIDYYSFALLASQPFLDVTLVFIDYLPVFWQLFKRGYKLGLFYWFSFYRIKLIPGRYFGISEDLQRGVIGGSESLQLSEYSLRLPVTSAV